MHSVHFALLPVGIFTTDIQRSWTLLVGGVQDDHVVLRASDGPDATEEKGEFSMEISAWRSARKPYGDGFISVGQDGAVLVAVQEADAPKAVTLGVGGTLAGHGLFLYDLDLQYDERSMSGSKALSRQRETELPWAAQCDHCSEWKTAISGGRMLICSQYSCQVISRPLTYLW